MVHVGVIVGGTQGILGLPFILRDPQAYISNAFDFSRMFLYKWTVNWRFLGEKIFSHPATSKVLLGLHVFILCIFGVHQWTNISKEGWKWVSSRWKGDSHPMSASFIVRVLCTSNLIGMTFARSLHYQFYSWYAFQLPLLAWSTTWSLPLRYVARVTNKVQHRDPCHNRMVMECIPLDNIVINIPISRTYNALDRAMDKARPYAHAC